MNSFPQGAHVNAPSHPICAVCVDMGTTHTRVWLVHGETIVAHARARLGIQDAAKAGSAAMLRAGLAELVRQVREQAKQSGFTLEPAFVVAAGMITSPMGLANVPHLQAPAGRTELAAAIQRFRLTEVAEIPFLLVPGVRSGGAAEGGRITADRMRGEETLCVGLVSSGLLEPPATLLNLGSHWKAIQLGDDGRIAASVTSLAGEMIQAAQTQTLLTSSLPQNWPEHLNPDWIDAGMKEQRQSGLLRALFCVRLHDQLGNTTPEERFAFLIGAFVSADLDALTREFLTSRSRVLIAGSAPLAGAWQHGLNQASITSRTLSSAEVESAFLCGLREIAIAHLQATK